MRKRDKIERHTRKTYEKERQKRKTNEKERARHIRKRRKEKGK